MFVDLVEYIVKGVVDRPEEVEVREVSDDFDDEMMIEIKVNPADSGRVIGKEGRVINAMRTLLNALAGEGSRRISVELLG